MNVLISAILLQNSIPFQAFRYTIEHGDLLLSKQTHQEFHKVLQRPKIQVRCSLLQNLQFLEDFEAASVFVEISYRLEVCRDPKDNSLLEVALYGKADALVSGDQDLLVLHPFEGIPILKPRDFLASYAD